MLLCSPCRISPRRNADVRKHIGESKLYFGGIDTSHCGDAGVPNWGCGRLQSGAKPYLTQGQDITDKKLNVQTKSVGPAAGRALVKISVENGIGDLFDRAFNALIKAMSFPLPIPDVNFPTGPAIDADFNIMVTYVGPRRVKVAIAGTHDGFPSYEVRQQQKTFVHCMCSREMIGCTQSPRTARRRRCTVSTL